MSSLARTQAVSALLEFTNKVSELRARLRTFPKDFAGEGVALSVGHLAAVLDRFALGRIEGAEVEEWANAVELRDDVDYDGDSVVGRVLHELANPELEGALSPSRANELLSQLRAPSRLQSSVGPPSGL